MLTYLVSRNFQLFHITIAIRNSVALTYSWQKQISFSGYILWILWKLVSGTEKNRKMSSIRPNFSLVSLTKLEISPMVSENSDFLRNDFNRSQKFEIHNCNK